MGRIDCRQRKKAALMMLNRTSEEEAEENAILEQAKAIEAARRAEEVAQRANAPAGGINSPTAGPSLQTCSPFSAYCHFPGRIILGREPVLTESSSLCYVNIRPDLAVSSVQWNSLWLFTSRSNQAVSLCQSPEATLPSQLLQQKKTWWTSLSLYLLELHPCSQQICSPASQRFLECTAGGPTPASKHKLNWPLSLVVQGVSHSPSPQAGEHPCRKHRSYQANAHCLTFRVCFSACVCCPLQP